MALPPILYHHFKSPLPYARTLQLQERIHQIQLAQRRTSSHKDYLLLLEHRPVYTSGRRQTEHTVEDERNRLINLGADFVTTQRGGQLTYHGPGQIVGYPLMDLSRSNPTIGIRDYICKMQRALQRHLKERHGIDHVPSDNTGVFLSPTQKIASIGVQVRHRLTTHGFAMNITQEPQSWFNQIVACGLADVKAVSVESTLDETVKLSEEIDPLATTFAKLFDREAQRLDLEAEGEVGEAIAELEREAELLEAGNDIVEDYIFGLVSSLHVMFK